MNAVRQVRRLVRHAVVFEININASLLRWVLRRPSVAPGSTPLGYAQIVTPVLDEPRRVAALLGGSVRA